MSQERVPKKKLRNFGHMSKLQVGRVLPSQTFSEKKVWTKKFEVGRSDMDVHTYIPGIGRGVLRKNPAKILQKKWGNITPGIGRGVLSK